MISYGELSTATLLQMNNNTALALLAIHHTGTQAHTHAHTVSTVLGHQKQSRIQNHIAHKIYNTLLSSLSDS